METIKQKGVRTYYSVVNGRQKAPKTPLHLKLGLQDEETISSVVETISGLLFPFQNLSLTEIAEYVLFLGTQRTHHIFKDIKM